MKVRNIWSTFSCIVFIYRWCHGCVHSAKMKADSPQTWFEKQDRWSIMWFTQYINAGFNILDLYKLLYKWSFHSSDVLWASYHPKRPTIWLFLNSFFMLTRPKYQTCIAGPVDSPYKGPVMPQVCSSHDVNIPSYVKFSEMSPHIVRTLRYWTFNIRCYYFMLPSRLQDDRAVELIALICAARQMSWCDQAVCFHKPSLSSYPRCYSSTCLYTSVVVENILYILKLFTLHLQKRVIKFVFANQRSTYVSKITKMTMLWSYM